MLKRTKVSDIRMAFKDLLAWSDDENEMLEIVNASFVADKPTIFGELNHDYIESEKQWYLSESLDVYDIPGKTPQIWKNIADNDGMINSNYGWCQFSDANHNQYDKALAAIKADSDTRQATMIFNRPTMHEDAFRNCMSDFMCTYAHQLMLRDGKLDYLVFMRSNDVVFGYRNDKAWADYVHQRAADELGVELGTMYWNAASLHVYPRHRKLINGETHDIYSHGTTMSRFTGAR